MSLGEDVAGADVEQEPREHPQVDQQAAVRDGEQQRQRGTDKWGHRVECQQGGRAPAGVAVREHQRDGVEAVGEVVADDGDRHRDADSVVDLEGEADGDAVGQTVAGGRGGRRGAPLGGGGIARVRPCPARPIADGSPTWGWWRPAYSCWWALWISRPFSMP